MYLYQFRVTYFEKTPLFISLIKDKQSRKIQFLNSLFLAFSSKKWPKNSEIINNVSFSNKSLKRRRENSEKMNGEKNCKREI